MTTIETQDAKTKKLHVTVTYAAAKKPFKNNDVDRTETLLTLKNQAMAAFEVQESTGGNEQVYFWLYLGDTKLSNESETVGNLANGEDKLELTLEQQIVYGS